MICADCEHAMHLSTLKAYTCKHPECKEVVVFKGKTKPHICPLSGGKKYTVHGNVSRGTGNIAYDVVHHKYIRGG